MTTVASKTEPPNRRSFLKTAGRYLLLGIGFAFGGWQILKRKKRKTGGSDFVWQIDPAKCVQCGRCNDSCVLNPSAVKCMHEFSVCGYCNLCFGYFQPGARRLTEDAENQLCPTQAIKRKFIEEPYFEYQIDEPLCIGCAKCVKGCGLFGNGSLFLQVRHDRCVNCNECSIAQKCAGDAFLRVHGKTPYIRKNQVKTGFGAS